MKKFFNKFLEALGTFLLILALILFLPLILIWIIISTIFDYCKYKKSDYFKDTKEKYSWLSGKSYYVLFYDLIKSHKFSIEYYRDNKVDSTGYGYFVYKDVLLICNYDSDNLFFDKERNEWLVYDEHDYLLLETEIEEEIKAANEFFGETKCRQAALLIEKNLLDSSNKCYEKIKFLPIIKGDKISALKGLIDE